MRILLDPGHGGHDPGAVSGGAVEKDITLDVCLSLGYRLRRSGINILFTRDRDAFISPTDRLGMIRAYQPHAFVSIHCNAALNPQAHGIETFYRDDYDYPLAAAIHKSLIGMTEMNDRGVKNDIKDINRKLAVLGDLTTPACLVEIGFITNATDLNEILTDRDKIVEALHDGIMNWTTEALR